MDDNNFTDGKHGDFRRQDAIDQSSILADNILLGLDACRPASEDLQQPELAPLAVRLVESAELRSQLARVQRFDALLGEAIDDLPVPSGLSQRLLAKLNAERAAVAATLPAAASQPTLVLPARSTNRRKWLAVAASLAASLIVAAGGVWYLQPREITGADIPQVANSWFDQVHDQWQALPAPRDLPLPQIVAARPRGWQSAGDATGSRSVAYQFLLPGGGQAVLFAVRMNVPHVPQLPPARPQPMTGNRSVATWQSGGVLYVLVIKGAARDYPRLFKPLPDATA